MCMQSNIFHVRDSPRLGVSITLWDEYFSHTSYMQGIQTTVFLKLIINQ